MSTIDIVKTEVEIDKMLAEISKLRAETRKVVRETVWVPFVAGAAIMAAATGLATLVLKFFI